MVSQLTGYSQLDELAAMNEKLDAMTSALTASTATSGLDYLGKQVEADGYTVTKSSDDVSSLYFELENDADSLTVNIYDGNGSIINTETYGATEAGSQSYAWDGNDYDGNAVEDGNYYVLITASDADGDTVDVSTTTTGTVTGISTTDEGVMLTLDDGRTVNMLDVTYATS